MTGKTLLHYEVLDKLGQCGMGAVYRARDTKLERDVALKFLPEEFSRDPERLARFEREAKLLAVWRIMLSAAGPSLSSVARVQIGVEPARQLGGGTSILVTRPLRTAFAWTPDGKALVFSGLGEKGVQLYRREQATATDLRFPFACKTCANVNRRVSTK